MMGVNNSLACLYSLQKERDGERERERRESQEEQAGEEKERRNRWGGRRDRKKEKRAGEMGRRGRDRKVGERDEVPACLHFCPIFQVPLCSCHKVWHTNRQQMFIA